MVRPKLRDSFHVARRMIRERVSHLNNKRVNHHSKQRTAYRTDSDHGCFGLFRWQWDFWIHERESPNSVLGRIPSVYQPFGLVV